MSERLNGYRGGLKLAVLDLAGTVIDYGSSAPAGAFVELFAGRGISVSDAEARGPMGMHKRDHIAALCALPHVAAQWREKHGAAVGDADIDRMYADFIPLQMSVLPKYADLIPGSAAAVATLREMGLKIAFTTGYNCEMLDIVLAAAAEQGLQADTAVCGTDVPAGRPAPWMALECAARLNVYPPAACIKFGDTLVDIEAGLNAGMWSVGTALSGNMAGLSLAEWNALSQDEQDRLRVKAHAAMAAAGAHAVVDSVADAPRIVARVNELLAAGAWPGVID